MALRNEKLYFEGYKAAFEDLLLVGDHFPFEKDVKKIFNKIIEDKHKKLYPDCCGPECHSCPGCCGIGDPGPLE